MQTVILLSQVNIFNTNVELHVPVESKLLDRICRLITKISLLINIVNRAVNPFLFVIFLLVKNIYRTLLDQFIGCCICQFEGNCDTTHSDTNYYRSKIETLL